ncbi:hypothetical protein C8R46DRAFT_1209549 [Mycena filopes]|nr:hypothetical protein C8R46DRAFT_1209549 [Mycena filopes]
MPGRQYLGLNNVSLLLSHPARLKFLTLLTVDVHDLSTPAVRLAYIPTHRHTRFEVQRDGSETPGLAPSSPSWLASTHRERPGDEIQRDVGGPPATALLRAMTS